MGLTALAQALEARAKAGDRAAATQLERQREAVRNAMQKQRDAMRVKLEAGDPEALAKHEAMKAYHRQRNALLKEQPELKKVDRRRKRAVDSEPLREDTPPGVKMMRDAVMQAVVDNVDVLRASKKRVDNAVPRAPIAKMATNLKHSDATALPSPSTRLDPDEDGPKPKTTGETSLQGPGVHFTQPSSALLSFLGASLRSTSDLQQDGEELQLQLQQILLKKKALALEQRAVALQQEEVEARLKLHRMGRTIL